MTERSSIPLKVRGRDDVMTDFPATLGRLVRSLDPNSRTVQPPNATRRVATMRRRGDFSHFTIGFPRHDIVAFAAGEDLDSNR
jgi:hypothetical protein